MNLNILLDACEREKEFSKEDKSIDASYTKALLMRDAAWGGSSIVDSTKGLKMNSGIRGKQKGGYMGKKSSGSNASQRIVELESQLREMRDDLATLLQCSISFELMSDPVVTPSGYLYDRCNIEQWVSKNHTDPTTRKPLRRSHLTKVRGLKFIPDQLD